jgi:hypothetical protein
MKQYQNLFTLTLKRNSGWNTRLRKKIAKLVFAPENDYELLAARNIRNINVNGYSLTEWIITIEIQDGEEVFLDELNWKKINSTGVLATAQTRWRWKNP